MSFGRRFTAPLSFLVALLPRVASGAAPAVVEPEKPPVPLRLKVTEAGPEERWHVSVQNVSSVPVRLFADPRVLWFEVSQPGDKKPKVCKLPDDLFPKEPLLKGVKELRPGDSWEEGID